MIESTTDDGFTALLHAMHAKSGHSFVGRRVVSCDKHGDHERDIFQDGDNRLHGDTCGACATEHAAAESLAAHAKELRNARFGQAEIPLRFQDRTLGNYEATTPNQMRILAACREYAENFKAIRKAGTCMIFSGGVGTGKTHLSAAIANTIMGAGYSARFATVSGAVRRVRASWRTDENEQAAINLFCDPDLLILDEIGVQSGSENEHQIVFEILNARYERMLPTILLSNLPLTGEGKTVRTYLGDRITDRLREGGGKAFVFDWSSGRGSR